MFQDRANANVIPILTALVVGYFFLEAPWRWLILIPAAAIDAIDIIVWLRWRKRRSETGSDALHGARAKVVSVEKPGEVMVQARGQLWRAVAPGNVGEDDYVVVTEVDGIRLKVEAAPDPPPEATKVQVNVRRKGP